MVLGGRVSCLPTACVALSCPPQVCDENEEGTRNDNLRTAILIRIGPFKGEQARRTSSLTTMISLLRPRPVSAVPRVIQPVFEIAELPGRASIKAEARLFGSAEDGTDDWKRMLDTTSTCVSQSIVASHRYDCLTGSLSLLASQLEEQLSTVFAKSATWLVECQLQPLINSATPLLVVVVVEEKERLLRQSCKDMPCRKLYKWEIQCMQNGL